MEYKELVKYKEIAEIMLLGAEMIEKRLEEIKKEINRDRENQEVSAYGKDDITAKKFE